MVLVVVLVFEAARKECKQEKKRVKIRSQSRQETMGLRAQREWLV